MRLAQEILENIVKDVVEDGIGLDREGSRCQRTDVPKRCRDKRGNVVSGDALEGRMHAQRGVLVLDTYNLIESIAVIVGRRNDARLSRGSCHCEDCSRS